MTSPTALARNFNVDTYLPAKDAPGKEFKVYVYKPAGRPAYAAAVEGKMENGFFTTILFDPSYRQHRVDLGGTNTLKNRQRAVHALLDDMVERGWIDAGDASVHWD